MSRRLLFMGRKAHAAKALEWCIGEGWDVVGVVTDHHLTGSHTTAMAKQHSLRILDLEDVMKEISEGVLEFDLAVSYVYWRILKDPLISFPPLGIINFHPAPLPDLKGTAGYNVAILEGRNNYAVTAHYVDKGLDTGPIIEKMEFSMDPDIETAVTLEGRSQDVMLNLFKKTLRRVLEHGRLEAKRFSGGRYISRREMEEMKEIHFGDNVDRKARAFWFPPYDGAYIKIDGQKYTLVNRAILNQLGGENTNLFSV